ncbi:hypothetical protein KAS31_05055, partial [Candidatus Parcubacteria bacterium]|nr:hypothetical protein [Candidatus Parcubacteria bacterium]
MKNKYFVKNKNKEALELEELFLDSMAEKDGNIEIPLGTKNIEIVKKALFFVFLVLTLQAGYLQIIKGKYYAGISENNYKRTIAIKSPRGIIYDRNNKQIVFNVPIFDLVIVPYDFLKDKDNIKEKTKELSSIIKIEEDDLMEKINDSDRFSHQSFLILENIKKNEALILEEKIKNIDGVKLEKNAIRNYVDSKYISNVIGYSGRISEKELENNSGYLLTDIIGKDGLEFFYETQLRGKYGKEEVEVDSFGKKTRIIGRENFKSGNNLILNIDSDLQKNIYDQLNEITTKLETEAGASVVVLDPR